jgi:hypothetical protein
MPRTLSEVSQFTADVTVPHDGDGNNVSTIVDTPHQAITDRQLWLYDHRPRLYTASSGVPYGPVGGARGAGVETVALGANSTTVKLTIAASELVENSLIVTNICIPAYEVGSGSGTYTWISMYDVTNSATISNWEGVVYAYQALPAVQTHVARMCCLVDSAQAVNGVDIRVRNSSGGNAAVTLYEPWYISVLLLRA